MNCFAEENLAANAGGRAPENAGAARVLREHVRIDGQSWSDRLKGLMRPKCLSPLAIYRAIQTGRNRSIRIASQGYLQKPLRKATIASLIDKQC